MLELTPQLFEAIMLFCFGSSWPFAVFKSIRTKAVGSKCIVFLVLIFCGYLSGIMHKLAGRIDLVIWLYVINGSMVFTEIILYFRYRRFERIRLEKPRFPERGLNQCFIEEDENRAFHPGCLS